MLSNAEQGIGVRLSDYIRLFLFCELFIRNKLAVTA
jgi:hypothetical protein